MTANKSLKKLPIDTTIYTDASLDGTGDRRHVDQTRADITHQC